MSLYLENLGNRVLGRSGRMMMVKTGFVPELGCGGPRAKSSSDGYNIPSGLVLSDRLRNRVRETSSLARYGSGLVPIPASWYNRIHRTWRTVNALSVY